MISSILAKEKFSSSYHKSTSFLARESKRTSRTSRSISYSHLLQSELLDEFSFGRGLEV